MSLFIASLTRKRFALVLCSILVAPAVFGQLVRVQADASGQPQVYTFPKGTLVTELTQGDSLHTTFAFDPNENVRLIVLFDEPPLALHQPGSETGRATAVAQAAAAIDAQHLQFRTDIATLEAASKQGRALAPATTVFRQAYRTALNGMAVTTRRWMTGRMASLPYVRGVYEDRAVEALDAASNRVIGADRAHRELGTTGQGILVAIIDTGIDYTHPALGGDFGPGFKVEGGYDFIDDDTDPMDDNGHGTHVAGIVAGDDGAGYVGVAPDARLLAYRVLDANGSGEESGVLAAIERALDPDGDPATGDAVDVINLSLGGPGGPDDPSAQAIDNATAAGVVCVIAAGNAGQSYAIGSPGVARSAITVGASDNQDLIADFSSRGPVAVTFENKPDVLAPGVAISSSIPGGAYEAFNGTSMATPHVAGAVALLLERHPTWDPTTIKSVLMQSAIDLGERLWVQGSGRIDIMAADTSPAVTMPASFSLGNVDPAAPATTFERTLTLRNLSNTALTFSLSASHSVPGVEIEIASTTLHLAPDATGSVTVSFLIDTALLPYSEQFDNPHIGYLMATDGDVTLRVPFSVMKTPQLVLNYDDPPLYVVVLGSQGGVASVVNPGQVVALPLLQGTYDVISTYEWHEEDALGVGLLVNEHVAVTGRQALQLSRRDVLHTVGIEARDRDGQPLPQDYSFLRVIHASGFTQGISGFDIRSLQVSDLSARFKVEYVLHNLSHPSGADYVVPLAAYDGITASTTLRNDPSAFRQVHTTYAAPPDARELFFMPQVYEQVGPLANVYSFYLEEQADDYRLLPPFERTVYYAPIPGPGFSYRNQGHEVYNTTDSPRPVFGEGSNLLYFSPVLRVSAERMETFAYPNFEQPLRSTEERMLEERLGGSPLVWSGRMANGSAIRFDQRKRMGLFLGTDGDIPAGPITYELRRENTPLQAGVFFNDLGLDVLPEVVDAARYELRLAFSEAFVDDRTVHAEARLAFSTQSPSADPNPPYIERLFLTSGGTVTTAFAPSQAGAITAVVGDTYGTSPQAVTSAQLSVRRLGETDWTGLDAVRDENMFTAAWPSEMPAGYYALRLAAGDPGGNTLDYQVDPAFRAGQAEGNHAPGAARLLTPVSGLEIDLDTLNASLHFTWRSASDPDNGQLLRYAFHLSGPGLDVMRATSDTTLALAVKDQLRKGSSYTWTVETTDGFILTAPAAVHTFEVKPPSIAVEPGEAGLPASYALSPNYPNPFNPTTTITFSLPEPAEVHLEVFDVLGRRVAVLAEGPVPAGTHMHTWTATRVPSGVYYARLQAGTFSQTRQMVLLK